MAHFSTGGHKTLKIKNFILQLHVISFQSKLKNNAFLKARTLPGGSRGITKNHSNQYEDNEDKQTRNLVSFNPVTVNFEMSKGYQGNDQS